jgi:cell division protein FtsQ
VSTQKTKGATKRREPLPIKRWFLSIAKVCVVCGLSVVVYGVFSLVSRVDWQPLAMKQFEQTNTLVYQDQQQVELLLNSYIGQSLLFMDLTLLKAQLEALPWVSQASILKRWPGELVVSLTEHEPVAFWNSETVLNSEGIPLTKPFAEMDLAQLNGPDGHASDVMEHYLQFARIFNEQGLILNKVYKQPRGAWSLHLRNGIIVELGEKSVLERSRRVVTVLASEMVLDVKINYIDARYPNGVAIKYVNELDTGAEDDIAA